MSQIDFDDALLLMNVIKAASEHGNAASAIGSAAMNDLAEINAIAAEELKKATPAPGPIGHTGNTDLGSDDPVKEETKPQRRA